ncbi:MAG: 3-deoxy-D-manno-octulosonic acid transferase [Saprospiraceae bacterium]|nr:3-deoxy-D-manno-octulosonic acid transferase [Saprospiraceae bacterium]
MGKLFYYIGISLYSFAIRVAALFSPKAKLWVSGRKGIWQRLEAAFESEDAEVIWMHCASLGEFEQGRPLIEALKLKFPKHKLLLTFFSPSGYEVRKNYDLADWVFYLPMDGPGNAGHFMKIVDPKMVFFIKYEFWYYYLNALKQSKVPTYLVSAHFRPNQVFFKWYGGFFRNILECFTQIFVQNEDSVHLLDFCQVPVQVTGDTRMDRVLKISENAQSFPVIDGFVADRKVLVAGSTWSEDENHLLRLMQNDDLYKNYCLIIAPHQVDAAHIKDLENRLSKINAFSYTLYSRLSQSSSKGDQNKVLVIDNIGMLSSLYKYAHITYVGGGFGAGIHNILEAIVYKLPVIFGSKYQKFQEAVDLHALGVAQSYSSYEELEEVSRFLANSNNYSQIQAAAEAYIQEQRGATDKIMEVLVEEV